MRIKNKTILMYSDTPILIVTSPISTMDISFHHKKSLLEAGFGFIPYNRKFILGTKKPALAGLLR